MDVAAEYLAGAIALGYQTRVHDIEGDPLPYPDGMFDVVLAGETIEHLRDIARRIGTSHNSVINVLLRHPGRFRRVRTAPSGRQGKPQVFWGLVR